MVPIPGLTFPLWLNAWMVRVSHTLLHMWLSMNVAIPAAPKFDPEKKNFERPSWWIAEVGPDASVFLRVRPSPAA